MKSLPGPRKKSIWERLLWFALWYGRVTTGFGLQSSAKNEANHIEGEVGADPKTVLKVTADSGNIEVHKK